MKKIIILFSTMLFLVSCEGTWLMYDTSQKDRLYIEVQQNPGVVSMALLPDEVSYTIPVRLMGMPSGSDRYFSVEFIEAENDETILVDNVEVPVMTARKGTDFELSELVLPAGEVVAPVILTLKRQPEMADNYMSIKFRIVENEDFRPADYDDTDLQAIVSGQYHLYVTDGEVACPDWWDASTSKENLKGWTLYTGKFYPAKLRKLLEFYHDMENSNPDLYEQLVAQCGENLDKESLEALFFQKTNVAVWANYVMIPLYNYYKSYYEDEANKDDPNKETFASSGSAGTYWKDPIGMLR